MRTFRTLLLALVVAGARSAPAEELIWAGASGGWSDSGGRTWRSRSAPNRLVAWAQNQTAVFADAAGGAVLLRGDLAAAAVRFDASGGSFTLNVGGLLTLGGAGFWCAATADQEINLHGGTLRLADRASAATGPRADRLHFSSDSLITLTGHSGAGPAHFTSSGEIQFAEQSSAGEATIVSSGQIAFSGAATSGRAVITNNGILSFDDRATSAGAALINRGTIGFTGATLQLAALSIVNDENGICDFTASTGICLAALTNAESATLHLGAGTLCVAHLQLVDGNQITFHAGGKASGSFIVSSSIISSLSFAATLISIAETDALPAHGTATLIDWSAAVFVHGVELSHFALQPLPAGLRGQLRLEKSRLLLDYERADATPQP